MSNSKLVNFTKISPNQSGKRDHAIDGIAIHCVVGQCTVEALGNLFANPSLQASSNYGIGYDGKIGMYVPEENRAWTTSSYAVDRRCVTIEVASDTFEPLAVKDAAFKSLLDLVEDICRRNGIKKLGWSDNAADRKAWANGTNNGCNMQVHRDWANKSCPGTWLYSRQEAIKNEINKRLGTASAKPTASKTSAKSSVKSGDIVKIIDGAKYTTGKRIPKMILAEEWIVKSVSGSVAVIDKALSGSWAINSAVNTKYLIVQKNAFKPYTVRVTADVLNIRKKPGTNYPITGKITDKGVYTIIAESKGNGADLWGKLKSGAGWIALDYTKEA